MPQILAPALVSDRFQVNCEQDRSWHQCPQAPTGPYVATDRGILPLASTEGMAEVMDSAMLVSLGHTEKAAEYQRLIESHRPAPMPAGRGS